MNDNITLMVGTKTCTTCGRDLPLSAFGKHRISKDGLAHRCKECARANAKKYRQTPAGIYNNIQGRSRFYKGRPLSISKEDFIEWYNGASKVCVYCDIPEELLHKLSDTVNGRTRKLNIDRVINAKGYAKGNLLLCCQRCNYIKSDFFTYDEMREIGQKYVRPRWEKESANNDR